MKSQYNLRCVVYKEKALTKQIEPVLTLTKSSQLSLLPEQEKKNAEFSKCFYRGHFAYSYHFLLIGSLIGSTCYCWALCNSNSRARHFLTAKLVTMQHSVELCEWSCRTSLILSRTFLLTIVDSFTRITNITNIPINASKPKRFRRIYEGNKQSEKVYGETFLVDLFKSGGVFLSLETFVRTAFARLISSWNDFLHLGLRRSSV